MFLVAGPRAEPGRVPSMCLAALGAVTETEAVLRFQAIRSPVRASRIPVSGHAPSPPSHKFDGSASGVRASSAQHPNMVRASSRRPSTSDESSPSDDSSRSGHSSNMSDASNSDYALFVPRLNSTAAALPRLFLLFISFLCSSAGVIISAFVCRGARWRWRPR